MKFHIMNSLKIHFSNNFLVIKFLIVKCLINNFGIKTLV